MQLMLNIATILGGIAALVFFWERFSRSRDSKERGQPINAAKPAPGRPRTRPISKPASKSDQIPTILICAIGGICLGIIAGNFGGLALILSAFAFALLCLVGGKLDDWGFETIGSTLINGGFFVFLWGDAVGLLLILIEGISGIPLSGFWLGAVLAFAGGIVGIISGIRMTE